MCKKILFILFFLCIFSPSAYAENLAEGEALSLQEALKIAYHHNPWMVEAKKEQEAQQGRSFQKKALPDPEAEFSIGGFREQEDGPSKKNLDSYTLIQPIGSLGERWTSFSVADEELSIAQSQWKIVWGHIRTRIIRLYAQRTAREKALQFSRENLDSTRQLFVLVENRFNSGDARQSELIRARIEVLQAENEVLTREKEWKSAQGELNLNLGRPPDSPLTLSDFLSEETLSRPYQGLMDQALAMRPDLKIEQSRLSIQKSRMTTVYSKAMFPDMAVGFERTREDFENDSSVILKFSYPLWGFLGEVEETKAEYEKQKTRLDSLKQQVQLDIYQAFLEVELAERQVKIQKTAMEEANELLRQTSIQYEEGEIPFVSFLDNLKTIKETRLNYLDALSNYQEKIAVLDMAVGNIPVPEGALR